MSTWKKIIGTQETEFRVGLQGPKLVKGTGGLEVKTAAGVLTDVKAATFTGNGASLTDITGANVVGTVGSADVAYSVDGANVVGQVSDAASADVALSVAGANVTGEVAFAATANAVAGANVSGQVANAASADVALSVAGANVTGEVANAATANAVAGANVSGIVALATEAYGVAGANVTGEVSFAATANAVAGANVSGIVALATEAYGVAGANVVGQVANAASADVALSVAGANVTGEVAFAATANAVAGANVSGQVANAASADVALSVAGANVTGEVAFAATANAVAGANVSGEVSFAAVANSVAGANVSGQVSSAASADVALSVAGANVTGNVGGANIAYALSSDTANISILGGTAGQFLQTDGTGNVVFATVDTSGIHNGTSSVEIPTSGGNVVVTVGGNVITTVAAGGVTLTGNLDITGNVNVTGNLNYQNVTDMVVGDPLIFIGANNAADLFDLGFSASYNNGSTVHTGFARDATDGVWKLFDSVATEPTTTIDFAGATWAGFQAGAASLASAQVDGEIDTDTLVVQNGADLGEVSTLTIDGGNDGDVLTTDGFGVLSWVAPASTASKMDTLSGSFTFAGGIPYSATLPSGAVIDQVFVIVDTVFDGTPAVEVGVTGNTGKYVASTDTDLTVADRYEFPQSYAAGSGETVDVKVTNGGATVGAGRVIIHYSIPA